MIYLNARDLRRSLCALTLATVAGTFACAQAEPADKRETQAQAKATAPVVAASPIENGGYETVRVKRQNMPEYLPAVGALGAMQTTQIGSQVSGRLAEVLVDVGDVVKKDQPVAKIDTSFITIEVSQRRADLKSAEIRMKQTKQKWERIQKLFGSGSDAIIAEQAVDDARADFEMAQSQFALSTLAVQFAEQRLKEATIVAPYNGVITKRLADPGEPVASAPATHIMEIQETDKLELLFPMPQESFGLVKIGAPVHYQVSGASMLVGESTVERVYPEIDAATRSFVCRAIIQNPDLRLSPGLLVQVGVVRREVKNALALPRAAVFQAPGGDAVRVPKGTSYEEKRVKTGVGTLDTIEIKEGLNEGDEVLLLRAPGEATLSAETVLK